MFGKIFQKLATLWLRLRCSFKITFRFRSPKRLTKDRSPFSPGNNQAWQPHLHRFIYCLQPNQLWEMSGAMRGNQATNSCNIKPICERGNETFPFIFNWSLSLFVPSITRLSARPLARGKVEFPSSTSRLRKYYLRWITSAGALCPWAFSSFAEMKVFDSAQLSVCRLDKREVPAL